MNKTNSSRYMKLSSMVIYYGLQKYEFLKRRSRNKRLWNSEWTRDKSEINVRVRLCRQKSRVNFTTRGAEKLVITENNIQTCVCVCVCTMLVPRIAQTQTHTSNTVLLKCIKSSTARCKMYTHINIKYYTHTKYRITRNHEVHTHKCCVLAL